MEAVTERQLDDRRPVQKWGDAAIAGWQALPDVLLKNQSKLGLTSTEVLVLLNVLSFWWYPEILPYPRISTIAKRMNVSKRTVQRSINSLAKKKLLKKRAGLNADGEENIVYDPGGLVLALKTLAQRDPDFVVRMERMAKDAASAIF